MRITKLFDLTGKVAIVTGASKGIGESIARGLAEYGAHVIVSSRKQPDIDAVVESYRADGLKATAIAANMDKIEAIKNLYEQTVATCGGVDIIVNNAATNPTYGPIQTIEAWAYDKIMNVNVRGPLELCRLSYDSMKSRGGGSIINISSIAGLKPDGNLGMYSVSKAALISLTQVMAKEWGKDGIRANVICPGLVKTKFSAALWMNERIMKFVERNLPVGRIGQPDEMAGLALYLASDASGFCTGSVFTADGGNMIA